jgi:hypothetical protein
MDRWQPSTRTTIAICAVAVTVTGLAGACGGDDGKARDDLTEEGITNDLSEALVVVNPDGFPNVAHKCVESTGFWTTTDRTLILIYNDWLCPGSTREQDMVVINGVPRAVVNAGGG